MVMTEKWRYSTGILTFVTTTENHPWLLEWLNGLSLSESKTWHALAWQ